MKLTYEERLEENIKNHGSWLYNVRDEFKPLESSQIKQELNKTKLPCSVLIQNIEGDFNIGNIVRTSNNFNVKEIFYFGKKKFDRRAACGTYHYSPLTFLSSFEEVIALKQKYKFVVLENNIPEVQKIENFKYPENPLFVLGEESVGIHPETMKLADFKVEIPSRGSVRSLNVATAAGILLYDYWSKL